MRRINKISCLSFYSFFSLLFFCNLFFVSSLWALEGDKKWSFKTGGGIISSPAINRNGTIYIGSSDNKIYAINPDGSVRWSFSGSTAGITSSPAIGPDGIIYAGSYDYHLYAIHEDGTQKWAYNAGGQVNSSPAIGSDGTIYVGSGGSGSEFKLHAINPDGSGKWTFDCPVAWSSPAIGLDGTIYVGSTDGNLYAIYSDGSLKWKFSAGDFIYASPAIGDDGTIYIGANNGRLYAITPAGTQKWVFETGNVNFSSFFSPAIGSDGTIYAGSNYPNNKLYAINPDGTLNWTFDTGEVYLSTPAISLEGTIYVGSKLKKLFALNPDGTQKWEFVTQGFVESSPVIGTDGTIYVGSTDTYLYAIDGPAGGPAVSPWPMYRNNIHHTGCPDADGDGLFDYWEQHYFLDLSQGSLGDFDTDGLRNLLEFQMGLNPADSDTDNDGMPDGWEVTHSFDPLDENDAAQDADDDGISNLEEYLNGFDPHIKAPEIQFSVEPTSGLAPLAVALQVVSTGEITGWNWDFGDGTSSSEPNPTHTYFQTGTYTIILNAVGPGGSDTFSAPVESINTAPVTDAGPNQTVNEGSQVQLNGSNSHDLNNNIVSYQWVQLEGPSVIIVDDDTSQAVFTAVDAGPGGAVLNFQLTVTDNGGLKDTDTCIVNISWINLSPTADAGPNQTVNEGNQVTLNGSGSSDPDDGIASLQWVQTDGPPVALSDPSAVYPTFIAPDVGPAGVSLTFTLTVIDAHGLEAEDTCNVNVTWVNAPPTANAGPDQTVKEETQVILNGFGSYDPDDGISAYQWTQIAGTSVLLSDPSAVYPTFTAPDVGPDGEALIFQLEVTDEGDLKSTDTCIINVSWSNLPPLADAGSNQTVSEGAQVNLNGSGSSDSDDGIGSFQWTQIVGIPVSLSDPATVSPSFTAPDVGPDGNALIFQLTVTDGGGLKSTDTCIINVSWNNLPPEADAGPDQTIEEGTQGILNGFESSDPDDGIASYQWTQTAGPPVQLSDASAVYPAFTAPDVDPDGAALTFQLTVTDMGGLKATDTCIVNVTWNNLPPVADAGPDQTVSEGSQVILNGFESSDPDDGIATYQWTQTAGPPALLTDASAVYPAFTAPDVGPAGVLLTFQLTVTDTGGLKSTDSCNINISWGNLPPIANAGPDQTVAEGALVILNGLGSSDPDDGIGSYQWIQTAGTPIPLSGSGTIYPSFTALDVGPDGEALIFQLTVTDNGGLKATDTCIINISWNNLPPVADAGPDQTVSEGAQVNLSGSGSSDSDDGIGSYQWIQTGGTPVPLSGSGTIYPSFTAPDVGSDGEALIFQLTVTDNGGLKSTDTCIINISWNNLPPVADAGPDQTVSEGSQVILNGFESSDPDDGIGSYQWTQIVGTSVQLTDPAAVYPSFTAPDVGSYGAVLVFQLTITDTGGLKATDTCIVNISWNNLSPKADAGPDQTVPEGSQVILNGFESSDPDDGIFSYQWTQTFGTPVLLSDPQAITPSFTAPEVGPDVETLRFQLTVTDASGLKSTDTCIVNVSWVNLPPLADAGPDQTVDEGLPVTLNGTNSYDPDNETITYHWRQVGGPDVSIVGADTAQALITAPDVDSDGIFLQFELRVTDTHGLSAVDQVFVNVTWSNEPPVADAGANLIVSPTDLITLDGSGSYDRDGIDDYFWKQVSGPEAALSNSNEVRPTITLVDTNIVEASLVFELTVTDTGGLKAADTVIVNIVSDNLPPKADAGLNRNVSPHEEVMLDGLNSRDPDGAMASYEWKQIKGPTVILSQPDFVRPTFLTPEVDNGGVALTFELTVSNQSGLQDSDTVTVNVIKANAPPIAMAGGLQAVMSDEIITLTGTDSYDPDGSIATYRWRQLNGPKVILSNPLNVSPTFSVPDSLSSCASLEFDLTVTDNYGLSDTDVAIVNICDLYSPPVADAGSDLIVEEGDTVTLDALNSYSPDHDPVTYEWKQIAGPQVILSDAAASQPTFVSPEVEINGSELIFRLKVKDNHQLCGLSEVSVFIKDDGLLGTPPDAISFTTYDNQRMPIQCNGGASLVKLKAIDPEDILDSNNRPGNLIYGLMDIQIKVAKPGDTAYLTVYLPEPAPDGYQWFMWDEKNGWRESGSYAVFNKERDLVTITLIDGGFGDADVTPNGTIVDPAGLGTPDTGASDDNSDSGGGGGGGGGGCFIGTSIYKFNKITELLQKYFD